MATHVFLSSTSTDLAEYRHAAIDVCNRLGLLPIGMEFFGSMGSGATEGSKCKIERADVYVGVFAYRYGYIEAGYEKAVTEIEFDFAGECGIERVCFLVDPSYPWPVEAIERQRLDEVDRLRDKVERATIRETFTTVDDFRAKLTASLVDWSARHGGRALESRRVSDGDEALARSIPAEPALLVGRDRDLDSLRRRLGVGSESFRRLTVVRGWPGVGKTTLLSAIAHDEQVAQRFPDGVLWASLGENPRPVEELTSWASTWNRNGRPNVTLAEAIARARAALADRQALLIVDDVWEPDAAEPFRVGGSRCATVFTTRFPAVARSVVAEPRDQYVLERLSDAYAVHLLERLSPTVVALYPAQCRGLVADLEGLPLALRVAGRLLAREASAGLDVEDLFDELGVSGAIIGATAPEDRFDSRTGTTPTIQLLLAKSTDRLDPIDRERFATLGAFAPKPATFDLDALRAVWMVDDARPTVLELVDRGLLEPIPAQGRFWMHAVLVMHAVALLERL
jgi:hypothetical protein